MFRQREGQVLLVDVRESVTKPSAAPCRHIPGSRLHAAMLPDKGDVLLVCDQGRSSWRLTKRLRQQGYERVFSLRGGWRALENNNTERENG